MLSKLLLEHNFVPGTTYNPYPEKPDAEFEWNGHFFELFSVINPYAEASKFAASRERNGLKGHILTITSDEELQAVGSWLKGIGAPRVLLAASDANEEGRWTWIEGPEVLFSPANGQSQTAFWSGNHEGHPIDGEFSRWVKFEPNNAGAGEHCAELFLLGEDGLPGCFFNNDQGFNDNECDTFSAWLVVEFGADTPQRRPEQADAQAADAKAAPEKAEL